VTGTWARVLNGFNDSKIHSSNAKCSGEPECVVERRCHEQECEKAEDRGRHAIGGSAQNRESKQPEPEGERNSGDGFHCYFTFRTARRVSEILNWRGGAGWRRTTPRMRLVTGGVICDI